MAVLLVGSDHCEFGESIGELARPGSKRTRSMVDFAQTTHRHYAPR